MRVISIGIWARFGKSTAVKIEFGLRYDRCKFSKIKYGLGEKV